MELDNNKSLLITKYPVPMKNGITEDLYSIVWGVTSNPSTKKFCNVEQSVKSTWPMPQEQNITKIDNTIKFIEFCCQIIEENQWDKNI
ncbi:hypothetical protein Lnau_0994 [Legionella nautarum]|uniref:Uncharacterized protein n=1 Tax=Legionella nautarum TaxID=45070 RepID=A0A0W0WUK6_9GAMM|nr:hypothetical protein [Legionella nautarum]KTD36010.1 hypothetical protein Lnau_0994 [Legionella nautarum]